MNKASTTLMEKLTTRVHRLPVWMLTAICVLFFGLPFAIAFFEGSLFTLFQDGEWRRLALQPVIVFYIVAIAPRVFRSGHEVVEGFRSISQLEDQEFDQLVDNASRIRPRAEWIAIGVGVLFAFLLSRSEYGMAQPSALQLYWLLATMVMWGMMAWIIFIALVGDRRMAALHRQPLDVNIFDIEPFEPIGRQSLIVCLAFVGGTVISLLFVFSRGDFLTWQNLIAYSILVAVIILLFFVNMWRTHQVLSQAKRDALAAAKGHVDHAYRELGKLTVRHADTQAISAEISAWTTMEQRLKLTRTWPYDTEMLRTLFISALMPLFVAFARLAAILLSN